MKTENHEFIEQVVIPFYHGMIQKDIVSTVYDLDGKIITLTDLHARLWGYGDHKDMLGKSLAELIQAATFPLVLAQLEQIRQSVIDQQKTVTYINCFPSNGSNVMLLCYHLPIFNGDGEVVATRVLGEQSSLFDHLMKVQRYLKPDEINMISDPIAQEICLTNREQEILYLLAIGLSQIDAARYLGISRGALTKTVSSRICPKFGIRGSNTKFLIKKVIEADYFKCSTPGSLLKPRIIVMDNDFEFMVG